MIPVRANRNLCPECHEPMVGFQLEGVEIDSCLTCAGTWLDAGELELITELAGVAPGEMARALEISPDGSRTGRHCPRCRHRLREIRAGRQRELSLDRCPVGHGLWFDRGEVEAMIRSFADDQQQAVARFFSDLFHLPHKTGA